MLLIVALALQHRLRREHPELEVLLVQSASHVPGGSYAIAVYDLRDASLQLYQDEASYELAPLSWPIDSPPPAAA